MLKDSSIGRVCTSYGFSFQIVCIIFCFSLSPSANSHPIVQLPNAGTVTGRFTQNSREFLGLPYAKVSRWSPPRDLDKLPNDPFEANKFGPCCPQMESLLFIPSQDEDCLNLNVFAPRTIPGDESVPVMVWLHGGNENTGCSSQSIPVIYNGTNLVTKANSLGKSVVVVTLNYRLSILGTLYLEEIVEASSTNNNANFYIQDILSSLRWVQRFISAFGGDPDRVSLFGQGSAGNILLTLPTLPGAVGLFRSVIAQSSTIDSLRWSNATVANYKGHQAAEVVGCNMTAQPNMTSTEFMACLYAIPADVMTQKINTNALGSVIDGFVIPTYPLWAYEKGDYMDLSAMVLGWNRPDNFPLCRHIPRTISDLAMQWLAANLPLWTGATRDMVEQAIYEYNITDCKSGLIAAGPHESCCWLAEEILRDSVYRCHGRRFLNALHARKPGHQFWYDMNCCPRCPVPGRKWKCVCSNSAEIAYIFGTQSNYSSVTVPTCQWDVKEENFSEQVIDHWVSIATHSQPSDASSQWLPFDGEHIFSINSGKSSETIPWAGEAQCDFWDGIESAIAMSRFEGGLPNELWVNPHKENKECGKTSSCSQANSDENPNETPIGFPFINQN